MNADQELAIAAMRGHIEERFNRVVKLSEALLALQEINQKALEIAGKKLEVIRHQIEEMESTAEKNM